MSTPAPDPPPPASASHPESLGSYRILSLLGEGGMGAVYEAEQAHPKRRIALKVVRAALASEDMRRRFAFEGEVLGRLHHPAIAQVYECGTASLATGVDVPFLAMEYVEGARTLSAHIRATRPSLEERLDLFCRVVDGIEHAHQQGIVHRDLKPDNVLVDKLGQPKIIDFGLALGIDDGVGLHSMHTHTGMIMGTPSYMSPEQFAGRRHAVGIPSDVYALGVNLFEIVTGELPHSFDGLNVVEAARVVREVPPRPLSESGKRLRDDLDTIVAKALEKDPTRRYDTAAALAADVRRYLRREPVLARPASVLYQLRLFAKRHKAIFAAFAGVLLVSVVAAAVSLAFAFSAREHAAAAERSAYQARLFGAADAVEDQRMDAARSLLDATAPRLRGWEYRHLASRLDRSLPPPVPADWRICAFASSARGDLAVLRLLSDGAREWVVLDRDLRGERIVLPGTDPHAFAFSPDGSRAVWAPPGGIDGRSLALWDLEVKRTLFETPASIPASGEFRVSWSPTGDRFLVARSSPSDAATGAGFELRDGHTGALLNRRETPGWAYFSGDDRWILFHDSLGEMRQGGRTCRLLDSRTLEPVGAALELDSMGVLDLAEFRGSSAVLARSDGSLRLLDFEDGAPRERSRFPMGAAAVSAIRWSPDGRLVGVGGAQGQVRVFEAESGAKRADFAGPQRQVVSTTFLPGSGDLWVCDVEGEHRVWPVRRGSPNVLTDHQSFVYPVVVSRDGSLLMTGGWDGASGHVGALKLWDARTGAPIAAVGLPGDVVFSADFTPDGECAVVAYFAPDEASRQTEVIDLATGRVRATFRPTSAVQPTRTCVFPDGRRVLSVLDVAEAHVWDLATGSSLCEAKLSRSGEAELSHVCGAVSPDGRWLALSDGHRGIRILDADTYTDVRRWTAHAKDIWSLSFSPDGTRLVSASADQTVGVWDPTTGGLVAQLVGHGAEVLCAAMSPDGTRIASGGRDGYVRLWDTTHYENVAWLVGHESYIYSLAWSPDGSRLVSGSGDSTVRVWDTRPVTEQLAALQARAAALPDLEARLARALAGGMDYPAAVAAVCESPDLDARGRELARQVALGFALDREQARRLGGLESGGPDLTPHGPSYYRAPRAATPIAVDGRLDEPAWEAAPWTDAFVDIEGAAKPLPRHVTRAKMLWDDEFLYVAARLDEPHLWATLTQRDEIVFQDDDFEVFVDPEGDERNYGEVEVNALGTIFDLSLDRAYKDGGPPRHDWSPPGLRAGVALDGTLNDPSDVDRGWTVEIALPHTAIPGNARPPRAGEVWRINFSRVEWRLDVVDGRYVKVPDTREDNWVWSPQFAIDMHRPRKWGCVEFVGGGR